MLVVLPIYKNRCNADHKENEHTHRPSELEWDKDSASIVDSIRIVFGASKGDNIPTENVSRSMSVGALAIGRDFGLVLLQADFEVSVALVPAADAILRVPAAVAALSV